MDKKTVGLSDAFRGKTTPKIFTKIFSNCLDNDFFYCLLSCSSVYSPKLPAFGEQALNVKDMPLKILI